ncbi:MAG: hypothetical protein JSV62_14060 [Promethearchaeota archaeon]|nr:MAG: hypothetical protein JSV62_14060 [Candidatus Lokiarchaeota archaeon]
MIDILKYSDFEGNVGKIVRIIGKISEVIWQHLTTFIDTHPFMSYFDLEDEYQIVIYTKDSISCEKKLEIIGTLIKTEGKRKNPRSKINDEYFEYQLLVDAWKCFEIE